MLYIFEIVRYIVYVKLHAYVLSTFCIFLKYEHEDPTVFDFALFFYFAIFEQGKILHDNFGLELRRNKRDQNSYIRCEI
jgi:hypothetical protein